MPSSPNKFLLKDLKTLLSATENASGSYSSLDKWVPQGDRLEPQVIHRPLTPEVSTLWYFTSVSLPVVVFWSSVSTAIGEGSLPYMPVTPSCAQVVYSNCTTAKTVLPFTPLTLALSNFSNEVPSGQSEKNWRSLPATEVSMMGLLKMST